MGFRKTLVKTGLFIKKYSPTILAVAGTVCTIAGVVLACKASAESADDITEAKEEIQEIKETLKDKENKDEIKACKKEIRGIRWKVIKKVGPKYVISVLLMVGGVGALWASKLIVTYWLNGTSAAYIALENKYQVLEDGVRREYGEDALERLKMGCRDDLAEVRYTDTNGIETSRIEAFSDVVDVNQAGLFNLVFDKTSPRYTGDAEHDLALILDYQNHIFTPLLMQQGALSLDHIASILCIAPKDKNQLLVWRNTWWTYDPSRPDKDCHVNLRPKVVYNKDTKNYINGFDKVIVMDPNYDVVVTNGDYSEVYKAMK